MYSIYILAFLLQCFITVIYTTHLLKDKSSQVKYEIIAKSDANMFLKRSKRGGVRNWFASECCTEGCSYNEVHELQEKYGYFPLVHAICEVAHEARPNVLRTYPGRCSGYLNWCSNWCKSDEFPCGGRDHCVPKSYQCDSDNDCRNWKDEIGCSIRTNLGHEINKVTVLVKKYATYLWPFRNSGILQVGNRPVCADKWSDKNTKVICRGKFRLDKGIWRKSYIGSQSYRMSNVICRGNELDIGECLHKTSSAGCRYGVEIMCLNTKKLHIEKHSHKLYLHDKPFCTYYNTIDRVVAKDVCNRLFHGKFKGDNVPVFRVDRTQQCPTPGFLATCIGDAHSITDCNINYNTGFQLAEYRILIAECARCTPDYLLSLVKSISWKNTYQSVVSVSNKLLRDCLKWNCSLTPQEYPFYCTVKGAIDDIIKMSNTRKTHFVLKTNVNYGKLLDHNFLKDSFSKTDDKVENSLQKLAEYFGTIARFDNNKIKKDFAYLRDSYKKEENELKYSEEKLEGRLHNIYKIATTILGIDLAEQTVKALVRAAAFANPISSIVNTADNVIKAMDAVTATLKTGAKTAKLITAFKRFDTKILIQISEQREKNDNILKILEVSLKSQKDFSLSTANKFLDIYATYSPFLTPVILAKYKTPIVDIVEAACDVIENANSVAGAGVSIFQATKGTCPNIKTEINIMFALYESTSSKQAGMIETLANIARTKLKMESAKKLKNDLQTGVQMQLLQWKIAYALHQHKVMLIEEACAYIQYQNHGREVPECKRALENPDGEIEWIISYNYDTDMCRECENIVLQPFPIPAAISDGNTPKGTIDIERLYGHDNKGGWVEFTIPNNQWLVDNGWVREVTDKVFFVRQIQLLIPPSYNTESHDVKTTWRLVSNHLYEKSFMIPNTAMSYRYAENSCHWSEKKRENVYNPPGDCDGFKFNDYCTIEERHMHPPIYPMLVNSTWRLKLESTHPLIRPHPKGKFYFIAKVNFFSYSYNDDDWYREKRTLHNSPCCYQENSATDIKYALRRIGGEPCRQCPHGSTPQLYGNYCG